MTNKLGHVDPKTGAAREYTLTTAQSAPHGLGADPKSGEINLVTSPIDAAWPDAAAHACG